MTRPSSLDLGHTPRTARRSALQITNSPDLIPTIGAPVTPNTKLLRYEPNGYWIAGRQRRAFLSHLEQWSQNYDSSPHFHGKLSLSPLNPQRQEKVELGQPVICILTDTRFIDARRKIIVRLFPPPKTISHMNQASNMHHRHDSMDLLEEDRLGLSQRIRSSVPTSENQERVSDHDHGSVATGPYKLFVRCGANYISAREYFSKLYFEHLPSKKPKLKSTTKAWERTFIKKSKLLGHPPQPNDTITIRPLFHPFKRLPPELQDMILTTATGLSKHYNLCYDGHYSPYRLKKGSNAISLSTMFQISKKINEDLIPYVYHSTDFHFGLTGFTNFLWHAGPVNRPEIRRLTFHFGKLALLHCIRWLAPDHIFDLLEPPVITNPRSLQYFWRCQIQDLAKEVHLHTVTIDVKYIPITDLAMVVRILRCAFGSVRRIRLVETDRNGELQELSMEMKESVKLRSEATWRQMCLDYWAQHKAHQYFYKFELLPLAEEEFQTLMDRDKEHLDC